MHGYMRKDPMTSIDESDIGYVELREDKGIGTE
jgi:hypothetical protein